MATAANDQAELKTTMYAVCPKKDCPHVEHVESPPETINTKGKCEACQDATENWICLTCYKILCSRFVNEDMKKHYEDMKHGIALSFSDLSVWCYECNDYIAGDEKLQKVKGIVYQDKFGEPMPGKPLE